MQPETWLIHETALDAIAAAWPTSPEAVMTRDGKKPLDARKMVMRGSVAVIPINGPIFPQNTALTDFLDMILGVTTVESVAKDLQSAIDNPNVTGIVLHVNSPGGQVTGVNELADLIHASNKPTAAYINGLGASAAYWLASSANQIVVDPTALVGSIGTVFSFGPSGRGDGKKIISSQSPLKQADPNTPAGEAEYQRLADELTTEFVAAVARNRGVSADTVLSDFGQGGLKAGRAAVASGMADSVGSLESLISEMQNSHMRQVAAEESDMSQTFMAKVKGFLGMSEDATEDALAAEVERLKSEAVTREAEAAAKIAEAEATANAARIAAVEAETDAFIEAHGANMGLSLREKFAPIYQSAKLGAVSLRVAKAGVAQDAPEDEKFETVALSDYLEALVKAMPPLTSERVPAGGAKVDAAVAAAAGEARENSDAAINAKVLAYLKTDEGKGLTFNEAYLRVSKRA